MAEKFSRGEFLRRFLKPPAAPFIGEEEPDYLSRLPPEFTDTMLRNEIKRLGHDPEKYTKNQMAGLVLGAMINQTSKE